MVVVIACQRFENTIENPLFAATDLKRFSAAKR